MEDETSTKIEQIESLVDNWARNLTAQDAWEFYATLAVSFDVESLRIRRQIRQNEVGA
jgi:hypothetical protein